jgi:hypothetical protein
MIGSGIPINQSKAPFPKDIAASIDCWRGNALGFHRFHSGEASGRTPRYGLKIAAPVVARPSRSICAFAASFSA